MIPNNSTGSLRLTKLNPLMPNKSFLVSPDESFSTVGISLPSADLGALGRPLAWNTALQAHVLQRLWPEIEANYVYFKDGPNDGRHQLALAAGLVLGRFELTRRARLIVGGGYQKTVSSFHTFNHTWLLTARVAF